MNSYHYSGQIFSNCNAPIANAALITVSCGINDAASNETCQHGGSLSQHPAEGCHESP